MAKEQVAIKVVEIRIYVQGETHVIFLPEKGHVKLLEAWQDGEQKLQGWQYEPTINRHGDKVPNAPIVIGKAAGPLAAVYYPKE